MIDIYALGAVAGLILGFGTVIGTVYLFSRSLKTDMVQMESRIKSDLDDMKARTKSDLDDMKARTKSDLDDMKARTKSDLDDMESRIKSDLVTRYEGRYKCH
jgi:hypothetical protein